MEKSKDLPMICAASFLSIISINVHSNVHRTRRNLKFLQINFEIGKKSGVWLPSCSDQRRCHWIFCQFGEKRQFMWPNWKISAESSLIKWLRETKRNKNEIPNDGEFFLWHSDNYPSELCTWIEANCQNGCDSDVNRATPFEASQHSKGEVQAEFTRNFNGIS